MGFRVRHEGQTGVNIKLCPWKIMERHRVNLPWLLLSTLSMLNPLTAGTYYIRFLHFLFAYCISAFKQFEDIKGHKSAEI